MRIQDHAREWLSARNKTYVLCATLTAALLEAHSSGRKPDADALAGIAGGSARLEKSLESMAVVNIKKSSGESTSNDSEIREESYKNAPLLRRQIDYLAPTIIIACGTVCWHSLVYDLDYDKAAHDLPKHAATRVGEMILCHSFHPAARGGQFNIPAILDALLK